MRLPACALTTPSVARCQKPTALSTANDTKRSTLTATVAAAPAGTVVAALAGVSGDAGDYGATPLASSSTWQVSPQTGAFSWSYPIEMPAAPFGAEPQLALGYNSQSLDGRTAATNNQASWIGDGWDLWSGYVERSYRSCAHDQHSGANNTTKTGDACWGPNNATLSLNGSAIPLIQDATTDKWHLQSDDGSRVEHLTGGGNNDNNGEYWRVTTVDGTQYYFGRNRLPGWASGDTETNSTWTEPVYGNDPGEDCHASAFADSWCRQAWRWNLDYVVDPHGNAVAYWYNRETAYYGRGGVASARTAYARGGTMTGIDYGFSDGDLFDAKPAVHVAFTTVDRCSPNSTCDTSHTASWPDTPWDQACLGSTCTNKYTPIFFTRSMLSTITTQTWTGSAYANVSKWVLGHSFLDTGDNDADPLWLKSITHTGLNKGSASLPPITFDGTQKDNRVDSSTDGLSALIRYRISSITSESGAITTIGYKDPDCSPGHLPAAADSNGKRCMPAYWYPPGEDKKLDYFHKYVVNEVSVRDQFGGSDDQVTDYFYDDAPAWHYDDNPMVPSSMRTWSQWRGYGKVRVRQGNPAEAPSLSELRFYRGMNGDKQSDGTPRSATVTDSQGGEVTDSEQLAGFPREQITYDGDAVVSDTITDPWSHGPTATDGTQKAWMVQTGTVNTRKPLASGQWGATRTTTSYNDDGLATQVDDRGDTATAADNKCTTTTYTARNTGKWILNRAATVQTDTVACGTAPTPEQVASTTRYYYDNATLGAAVTTGDITRTEGLTGWNGTMPEYSVSAEVDYDSYGRILSSTDANGDTSTTAYTPAAGAPVTAVTTTDPLGHTTTNTLDTGIGEVLSTVDANGRRTDSTYDALGRLTAVWLPGRNKGADDDPNVKYGYQVSNTVASSVTTQTLTYGYPTGDVIPDLFYVTSYDIYDALLRTRQTQLPTRTGGAVVTDTVYDDRGQVKQVSEAYGITDAPSTTLRGPGTGPNAPGQTSMVYDGAGRQTASILMVGNSEKWRTTTDYPGADRTDVTPPNGGTPTSTIVDARGQTTELRQYHGSVPAGDYDATDYTYTPTGKLATVTDSSDNSWRYTYDTRGFLVKTEDPDTGTSTTAYDNAGLITSTTDGRGETIAYTYDELGRRKAKYEGSTSGTMLASWEYDTLPGGLGLPTSQTSYQDGAAYTQAVDGYDAGGRPTGTTVTIPAVETGLPSSYTDSYGYNPAGALESVAMPAAGGLRSEEVHYDYDGVGDLNKARSAVQHYVNDIVRNANGTIAQRQLGSYDSHINEDYQYETGTRRLIRATATPPNSSNVSDLHYTYDPAGEITTSTDYTGGNLDTQCYRYDHLDRLSEAWTPKATGSDGLTPGDCTNLPTSTDDLGGPAAYWHSYGYDASGNRTSLVKHLAGGDTTVTSTYPAAGGSQPHTLSSTLTSTSVGDGSTATEQSTFGYDAAGNTTSRTIGGDTQTLDWNADGTLAGLSTATGQDTGYVYDAAGSLLIRHDPDGSKTLYLPDGTQLRADGSGTAGTRYYSAGGDTFCVRTAAGIKWLVNDPNGTNNVQVDGPTLAATHRYTDPFGDARSTLPSWIGDRGFVGGIKDDHTGLTLLGAREYDPSLGRFLSADPLLDTGDPQQLNGYAYADNSPVVHSDPSGLMAAGGSPGTIWGNDSRGDAQFEKWMDRFSGGTAWRDDYYSMVRGWRFNQSVRETATAGGHRILDLVGYVPVIGTVADAANAVWYATEGDWANAGVSAAGAALGLVPAGKIVKIGGKLVVKIVIKGATKAAAPALERAIAKKAAATAVRDLADGAAQGATKDTGRGVKAAADAGAEDAGGAAEKVAAGCPHSFPTGTRVQLADGTSKPIDQIKIGDKIRNAKPDATKQETHRVDGVIVTTTDRDLVDITLATPDGPRTLTTTRHHRIWDVTTHHWTEAAHLRPGRTLQTSTAQPARIAAIRAYSDNRITYDLTINGLHTYYVKAGVATVLVHNCGGIGKAVKRILFGPGNKELPLIGNNATVGDLVGRNFGNLAEESKVKYGDYTDERLLEAVRTPLNSGSGQLGMTPGGTLINGVHRATELLRRLNNPKYSITMGTEIPIRGFVKR
ncbi:MAG: RHS repeat-associated core domain-containing protein [Actinocatenispora sp.]